MRKKMKFPFVFNTNNTYSSSSPSRSSSPWPWPAYCHQPKTLSFRNGGVADPMYKTINSAYNLDDATPADDYSWFTNSSESASFSTASDYESGGGGGGGGGESSIETVIKGLRSERLFFKPGETSRSILEEANKVMTGESSSPSSEELMNPFKESVVLSMDSKDPYADFKKSMEEMVEAHGLCDWVGLEELLCCYLRVNGRSNHGFIISAFVDLLVGLAYAFSNNSCNNSSPSSPLSFYTSSSSYSSSSDDSSSTPCCVSSLETGEEIDVSANCLTLLEEDESESSSIKN